MKRKGKMHLHRMYSYVMCSLLLFILLFMSGKADTYAASSYPAGTCAASIKFQYEVTGSDGTVESTTPVTGAEFSAYRVLQLNEDLSYTPVAGLEDVSYTFGQGDDLHQDAEHNIADAANFYEKIKSQSITADQTGATDSEGNLKLSVPDGKYGVYLIVQTGCSSGGNASEYSTVQPFIVQLPQQDDSGAWVYELTISPKVQLAKSSVSPTTPDEEPDKTPDSSSTPSKSTTTSTSSKSSMNSVKTGDISDPVSWSILFVAAAAVLAVLTLSNKKAR